MEEVASVVELTDMEVSTGTAFANMNESELLRCARSKDGDLKALALLVLCRRRDIEASSEASKSLGSHNPVQIILAVNSLVHSDAVEAAPAVARLLRSEHVVVRDAALTALGRLQDKNSIEPIFEYMARLDESNADRRSRRFEAALTLLLLGDFRSLRVVLPEIARFRGFDAGLVSFVMEQKHPYLNLDEFKSKLFEEFHSQQNNAHVRCAAATVLVRLGLRQETLKSFWLSMLENSTDEMKRWAIDMVVAFNDPADVRHLARLLNDNKSIWMRGSVIDALGKYKDAEAVKALRKFWEKNYSGLNTTKIVLTPGDKVAAGVALYQLGYGWPKEFALKNSRRALSVWGNADALKVSLGLMAKLADLSDADLVPALIGVAEGKKEWLRGYSSEAFEALGRIRSVDAIQYLADKVSDPDPDCSFKALVALCSAANLGANPLRMVPDLESKLIEIVRKERESGGELGGIRFFYFDNIINLLRQMDDERVLVTFSEALVRGDLEAPSRENAFRSVLLKGDSGMKKRLLASWYDKWLMNARTLKDEQGIRRVCAEALMLAELADGVVPNNSGIGPSVRKVDTPSTITAERTSTEASDSLRYCRHCGGPIPSDSAFCEHCGKKLSG